MRSSHPSVADEIIFVRPSLLSAPVPRRSRAFRGRYRRPNPRAPRAPREALKSQWEVDEASLRLYDGNEKLLVRTALLRAKGFSDRTPLVPIGSSADVVRLCKHLAFADQEHMVVLSCNHRQNVNAIFEAAIGGSSGVGIEAMHVLKIPLLTGATGIVIVHNHPSGNSTPSPEDVRFTKHISGVLRAIDVTLLDHVIVARDGSFSFLDAGMMPT